MGENMIYWFHKRLDFRPEPRGSKPLSSGSAAFF